MSFVTVYSCPLTLIVYVLVLKSTKYRLKMNIAAQQTTFKPHDTYQKLLYEFNKTLSIQPIDSPYVS